MVDRKLSFLQIYLREILPSSLSTESPIIMALRFGAIHNLHSPTMCYISTTFCSLVLHDCESDIAGDVSFQVDVAGLGWGCLSTKCK
jgi:hypothetical protein